MKNSNLLKNFEKFGDLYSLLEIKPTSTKKEIKGAYKLKALIYHPDKNKASDAGFPFKKYDNQIKILFKNS